jgi:geranylgeranyl diphosphate synthase type I
MDDLAPAASAAPFASVPALALPPAGARLPLRPGAEDAGGPLLDSPAVAAALARVEDLMRELAGGGPDDPAGAVAAEHLEAGGGRLRARLALAATVALGGDAEEAVGWAAACELLHNATLVHDDLLDGDRTRRGRPAAWARHGAAQALVAGDLLLMLPWLALHWTETGPLRRWEAARALAWCASDVARCQAAELALRGSADVSWDAWRRIAAGKTGTLFRLPVLGAAVLCGRPAGEAERLSAPFEALGVWFQLRDDLLDLEGTRGNPPGEDLREGKPTALTVEHLALHPGDGAWIARLLRLPRGATPADEVRRAVAAFRGGARAAACERMEVERRAVLDAPALRAEAGLLRLAEETIAALG